MWCLLMRCLYTQLMLAIFMFLLMCGACSPYCNNVVSTLLGVLSPVPPAQSAQTVWSLAWSHHLHSVSLVSCWQVHGGYQTDTNGPSETKSVANTQQEHCKKYDKNVTSKVHFVYNCNIWELRFSNIIIINKKFCWAIRNRASTDIFILPKDFPSSPWVTRWLRYNSWVKWQGCE